MPTTPKLSEAQKTKLTVTISMSITTLRTQYRTHYQLAKNEKVTKAQIAQWVGQLAEADIESI